MLAETALHLTCAATSATHNLLIHGGAVASIAILAAAFALRSRSRSV